jgi:2-polyprenyl-3-methyl-5-hydroxy-6-metoxy-1,4-benzoquinol methylase
MKKTVEKGYDEAADRYLETKDESTLVFARELELHLKPGARILDAGCGSGIPIAKYFSDKFEVHGIDISSKQIELARKWVPNGMFRKADMLDSGFQENFFDGIIALYSIIHVDRRKHLEILKEFYKLLKKPGHLMICMGLTEWEAEEDYLGTKMFWSHFDKKTNIELLKKAGFEIVWQKEWANPKDASDRHLFALCRK